MAWFALNLRSPVDLWRSPSSSSEPRFQAHSQSQSQSHFQRCTKNMYISQSTTQPADTYTVRIYDPSSRPNLLANLRRVVEERGGIVNGNMVEGRGFIFSMPPNTPNPLTGYGHGNLLEEGCISVTKTTPEKQIRGRCGSVGSSSDEDEEREEELKDHENLRMQWTWTQLKR